MTGPLPSTCAGTGNIGAGRGRESARPAAPKSPFTCSGNRVKRVEWLSTYAILALLARDKNCPGQQSTTSRIRPGFRYEKTPSVVRFKDNKKL